MFTLLRKKIASAEAFGAYPQCTSPQTTPSYNWRNRVRSSSKYASNSSIFSELPECNVRRCSGRHRRSIRRACSSEWYEDPWECGRKAVGNLTSIEARKKVKSSCSSVNTHFFPAKRLEIYTSAWNCKLTFFFGQSTACNAFSLNCRSDIQPVVSGGVLRGIRSACQPVNLFIETGDRPMLSDATCDRRTDQPMT